MLSIIKPDDFHIHIREGQRMVGYLKDYAPFVQRVVPMPNTQPSIDTVERLISYRQQILDSGSGIEPIMIFKLHDKMNPSDIPAFKKAGAIAAKLYPVGATTNSEEGVSDIRKIDPLLKALEENNLVLSIHGERVSSFSLEREADFLEDLLYILQRFPKLRVVMEHLSDRRSVDFIEKHWKQYKVAGTITIHHPLLDLDDLLGEGLNPHHFCKPIIKTPADKKRLQQAFASGLPCFFFGSDSAPHPIANKERHNASAGVYSAPVAIPLLTEIFETLSVLNKLEDFTSKFGCAFYELPQNTTKLGLVKKKWTPKDVYVDAKPFWHGKTLQWDIER